LVRPPAGYVEMTDDRLRRSAVTYVLFAAIACALGLVGTLCALLLMQRSVPSELYQLLSVLLTGMTVATALKYTERQN
jgi:uncharacterized protein YacL